MKIIEARRSLIFSADVPEIADLEENLDAIAGIKGLGGVKLGFMQGMQGLMRAADTVKVNLGVDFPIIFDHQKAGNDIPEMGEKFATKLKDAGVHAAILFPFAGPATQEAWTKACKDAGLKVIIGGVMTHPKFLVSEGGYIADEAPERIFRSACRFGITNFVVPGTKLDWVTRIRSWLVEELGENNFDLFAPGFITQGGDISECGKAAGDRWHPIVGSAIYNCKTREEKRAVAFSAGSKLDT